ncbi:MAG: NADH-quinone oxidoreductase subunit C [Planctomycetes bacterium]|nr:NADH-quinone oxidoreductase subunit C [Planctomycetota bacterium]
MTACDEVVEALRSEWSGLSVSAFRDQVRITVPRDALYGVLARLKHSHGFDFLTDITCVDYLRYAGASDRFMVVYMLTDTRGNRRITVKVPLNEPDLALPTVVPLWEAANWLEREVWDMMGIVFRGHPDLRRILLPEAFTAHPQRKDYPLQGRGERHHFPVIQRGEA